jgi:hypothetical protein
MAETLLTPSSIKLFGRLLTDLVFKYNPKTVVRGFNNFLQHQLNANSVNLTGTTTLGSTTVSAVNTLAGLQPGMTVSASAGATPTPVFAANTVITSIGPGPAPEFTINVPPVQAAASVAINASLSDGNNPGLARIYAFAFEGQFYAIPRPPIFLVHGSGIPVGNWVGPSTLDQAGVAGREWDFSGYWDQTQSQQPQQPGPDDLYYWEYEKGDFSLRLDPEAGPFEQILLQMALRSGADRASGAGVSGAGVSGAGVSGAGVSGAGVSGAGVSGAGVSGAGVSGAGVRR